jgi:hypothetical protein
MRERKGLPDHKVRPHAKPVAQTFVDNGILPIDPLQKLLVLYNILVRCEKDVELAGLDVILEDVLSNNLGAFVTNGSCRWTPLGELILPVAKSRKRHYDQVRTKVLLEFHEISYDRNRLDGLAEAL